ncbi:MAG: hypothetical protein QOG21_2287 [Actinomycetota bacterium]|nr:hypothetical protein [Actinomycetota bacterium]
MRRKPLQQPSQLEAEPAGKPATEHLVPPGGAGRWEGRAPTRR